MDDYHKKVPNQTSCWQKHISKFRDGLQIVQSALDDTNEGNEKFDERTVKMDKVLAGFLREIWRDINEISPYIKGVQHEPKCEVIGLDKLLEDFLEEQQRSLYNGPARNCGPSTSIKVVPSLSFESNLQDESFMKNLDYLAHALGVSKGCNGGAGERQIGVMVNEAKKTSGEEVWSQDRCNDLVDLDVSLDEIPIQCELPCTVPVDSHLMDDAMTTVGPFKISVDVKEMDRLLLEYVFDSCGDGREVVVETNSLKLCRDDIRSLCPNEKVNNNVIDLVAELLTLKEQNLRGHRARCWWIPTYVSRPNENDTGYARERTFWMKWVGNFVDCDKIYLPLRYKHRWFAVVVHVKESLVVVSDSIDEIRFRMGMICVDDILQALDEVFEEEIIEWMPYGWKFLEFDINTALKVPPSCIDKDSGIYVIKVMQAAYNRGILCNHGFNDEERCRLALQLLKSPLNKKRLNLANSATQQMEKN